MAKLFVIKSRDISLKRGFWNSFPWKRSFSCSNRSDASSEKAEIPNGETPYEDDIKEMILEKSLPFVIDHGWSKYAITKGAAEIGYPGVVHGVFSNPSAELIDYFNRKCNRELMESMRTSFESDGGLVDPKKFIENAFRERLKMIIPYIEKWPEALAVMSLPKNFPIALNTFSVFIDDVCHFSGDKSVDFNWYSRRLALGLIYKSTELCMVEDKTVEYIKTWTFLKRRIEEAFAADKIMKSNEEFRNMVREITTASYYTFRNILGWK